MENHPSGSALLVMDVQDPIVGGLAGKDAYLQRLQNAVDAAHARGIPVIFVVVGFRPGAPEFHPRNKGLRNMRDAGMVDALVDPVPALTPKETDTVITKRRVSAFSGSDLEVVLRSNAVDHLVLAGVSTSGVVLSTLREAVDKDYQLTVLSDLCADRDDEVHHVLTEKVFPRHAEVVSSTEWIEDMH
jgi:nicotinamidase-related amidase